MIDSFYVGILGMWFIGVSAIVLALIIKVEPPKKSEKSEKYA